MNENTQIKLISMIFSAGIETIEFFHLSNRKIRINVTATGEKTKNILYS